MHEASLLEDPIIWYGLGVALFFFIVWKIRAPILAVIDAEIAKVRAELDQARKLRDEAEASLSDYQERQKAALREAEAILAQARADADKLRARAEADIQEHLRVQEEHALRRIEHEQQAALQEVRALVLSKAIAAARDVLAKKIDAKAEARFVEEMLASSDALVDSDQAA